MMRLVYLLFLLILTGSLFSQEPSFFSTESIQKIEVKFDSDTWKNDLDSLFANGQDYLLASVVVNGEEMPFSGVRIARNLPHVGESFKFPVEIKLDFINKGQNYQGYSDLVLSQALRDPSLVREVLYAEMASKYMHAPRANYAHLTIDNIDYGILVNHEAVNKEFMTRHFGEEAVNSTFIAANIYKGDRIDSKSDLCTKMNFADLRTEGSPICYFDDYTLLSESGWDDLVELTRILNQDEPKLKELNEVLDLDQAIWYIAMNNLSVNLKSYLGSESGNFYLMQDAMGKFQIIPWSTNLAFGTFKNTGRGSDLNNEQMVEFDPYYYKKDILKPLVKALLSQPELMTKYRCYHHQLYSDYLKSKWFVERISELQAGISNRRKLENDNYYSFEQFEMSKDSTIGRITKIPGIQEFLTKRRQYLKLDPMNKDVAAKIESVDFKQRKELSSKEIEDFTFYVNTKFYPKRVHLYYKLEDQKEFMHILMSDSGKKPDKKKGDNVFSATIPSMNSNSIDYYFRTENVKMDRYDPPNFMFEHYNISLDSLNN